VSESSSRRPAVARTPKSAGRGARPTENEAPRPLAQLDDALFIPRIDLTALGLTASEAFGTSDEVTYGPGRGGFGLESCSAPTLWAHGRGDAMSRSTTERRTMLLGVLAGLFVSVGLAAAVLPTQWIESMFEAEPDGGDGSFELLLALAPALIGVALGTVAFLRWRGQGQDVRAADVVPGTTHESTLRGAL
jgi:hypothetical protein